MLEELDEMESETEEKEDAREGEIGAVLSEDDDEADTAGDKGVDATG